MTSLSEADGEVTRATMAVKRGNFEEALDHYTAALRGYNKEKRRSEAVHVLSHIGSIELKLGRPEEATEALRSALDLHRQLDDPAGKGFTLVTMADAFFRLADLAEARRFIDEALSLADTASDKQIAARVASNVGQLLLENATEFERAYKAIYLAHHLYQKLDDKVNAALKLADLARLLLLQRSLPQALDQAQKALALYSAERHDAGLGRIYGTLGLVRAALNQTAEAVSAFEHAIQCCKEAKDSEGAAEHSTNLCRVLVQQGRMQDALVYVDEAIAVCRQTKNRPTLVQALRLKAQASIPLKKIDEAFLALSEALSVAAQLASSAPKLYTDTYWSLIDALRMLFQSGQTKIATERLPKLITETSFPKKDDQLLLSGVHELAVAAERGSPPGASQVADQIKSDEHQLTLLWFTNVLILRVC
jgi:tetratricopeptide (TPR) repeat protein